MKCAVAIFAKTPEMSPVKTRLAADIGKEHAEAFYRLSVQAIEETFTKVQRDSEGIIVPYWTLAEELAVNMENWQSFPAIWTGEGDLGERLHNVSARLFEAHDMVMLVGTDSPQLSADMILSALNLARDNPADCIVGPAHDGGFYLFATMTPLRNGLLKEVTYSASTTLKELAGLIENQGRSMLFLNSSLDVDDLDSRRSLKVELEKAKTSLLPKQIVLLKWIEEICP